MFLEYEGMGSIPYCKTNTQRKPHLIRVRVTSVLSHLKTTVASPRLLVVSCSPRNQYTGSTSFISPLPSQTQVKCQLS